MLARSGPLWCRYTDGVGLTESPEFAGNVSRCPIVRRIGSLAFVIGCTPAVAPVTTAEVHVVPVAAVADAGTIDAGTIDAPMATACAYDKPDSSVVMPTGFARTNHKLCDLRDRIIIVDGKLVTVVSRPELKRTRAKVDRTEHLGNRCGDGPDGGHAGCSITFDRYWSAVLGARHLEFGTNVGNVLEGERDPNKSESCRDIGRATIATCSTAQHFVAVAYEQTATCWNVRASVWDGAADRPEELDGDVDRAASVGGHWAFRFATPNRRLTLELDRARRTAAVDIDGAREDCVTFQLGGP